MQARIFYVLVLLTIGVAGFTLPTQEVCAQAGGTAVDPDHAAKRTQ